jgi:hypothetical protein
VTTFRALTTGVRVDIADDVPDRVLVQALLRAYPRTEHGDLHYELRATELLRDGEPQRLDDPRDLVPLFEMDLYEQVGTRAARGWLLHAAALEVDGRALVLCGASGAGKTTLTLALASRGFRLLTEEVVLITSDGVVRGLPRPMHVPHDSSQRASIPASWTQLPYPIRGRDGVVRNSVLVVPPPDAFALEPMPLHTIVRMGHGPNWPTHLRPSAPSVALQKLWDRSLRQDDGGLEAATTVLREHGSFELSSSSPVDALALVETILK